jgi:hypothetical protein
VNEQVGLSALAELALLALSRVKRDNVVSLHAAGTSRDWLIRFGRRRGEGRGGRGAAVQRRLTTATEVTPSPTDST